MTADKQTFKKLVLKKTTNKMNFSSMIIHFSTCNEFIYRMIYQVFRDESHEILFMNLSWDREVLFPTGPPDPPPVLPIQIYELTPTPSLPP